MLSSPGTDWVTDFCVIITTALSAVQCYPLKIKDVLYTIVHHRNLLLIHHISDVPVKPTYNRCINSMPYNYHYLDTKAKNDTVSATFTNTHVPKNETNLIKHKFI